jgi:hypothetical protein
MLKYRMDTLGLSRPPLEAGSEPQQAASLTPRDL